MRLNKYLLNEKFTKKEMEDVFNNENIWIGAEFEFICYEMEEYAGLSEDAEREIQREYEDALDDWREYWEREEELRNDITKLENDRDELEDEKIDLEEEIRELENEDDVDYDRLKIKRDYLSNLEDKISDTEMELESTEDILEDLNIGSWYINYMDRYVGGFNVYELFEPPRPSDLEELNYLNRLKDEEEWKNIAQDVLPPIIEDASWPIEDYGIGGYKEIKQKKGENNWAFEYDRSVSPAGGVEMKTPPIKLPEFLEILPDILDWIDEHGYTAEDPTTGLHFHMSVGGVNDIQLNVDMVKLILFLEEDFIWKVFPERMLNSYTKEVKRKILRGIKLTNVSNYVSDLMGNKSVDPDDLASVLGDHCDAVHKVGGAKGSHVEFRHPGGENYHKKLKEIKELIGRYALILSLAVITNYKKKEYIQKIIRILNKIEWYRLDKKLEFYTQILEMSKKESIMKILEIPTLSDSKFKTLKFILERRKKQIQKEMNDLGVKLTHREKMLISDKIDINIIKSEEKDYIRGLLVDMVYQQHQTA